MLCVMDWTESRPMRSHRSMVMREPNRNMQKDLSSQKTKLIRLLIVRIRLLNVQKNQPQTPTSRPRVRNPWPTTLRRSWMSGGLKYWAFWDDATKGYVTSEYRADDGTIVQQVDGSAVSLDVRGGTMYVCGELTSLNIASVENSTKPSIIRFASGATKTQFSYPEDFKITGWTQPEENKSYTICILFGAGNMTYDE